MHFKCTLDYIYAFLQSLKYKLVGIPSKSLYAEVIFSSSFENQSHPCRSSAFLRTYIRCKEQWKSFFASSVIKSKGDGWVSDRDILPFLLLHCTLKLLCFFFFWSGDRMNKASCLSVLFLQWHLQACLALSMLLFRRLDLFCNCRNQTAGKNADKTYGRNDKHSACVGSLTISSVVSCLSFHNIDAKRQAPSLTSLR